MAMISSLLPTMASRQMSSRGMWIPAVTIVSIAVTTWWYSSWRRPQQQQQQEQQQRQPRKVNHTTTLATTTSAANNTTNSTDNPTTATGTRNELDNKAVTQRQDESGTKLVTEHPPRSSGKTHTSDRDNEAVVPVASSPSSWQVPPPVPEVLVPCGTNESSHPTTTNAGVDAAQGEAPFHQQSSSSLSQPEQQRRRILTPRSITIAHGSVTGTCQQLAQQLMETLKLQLADQTLLTPPNRTQSTGSNKPKKTKYTIQSGSMEDWDWWDELINQDDDDDADEHDADELETGSDPQDGDDCTPLLVLLLPTYTNGTWPPPATGLQTALQDLKNDWRVESQPLRHKLRVAIFGTGSSVYDTLSTNTEKRGEGNDTNAATTTESMEPTMGRPARQAVRLFQTLGARCITQLRIGDDATGDHIQESFHRWQTNLLQKWRVLPRRIRSNSKRVVPLGSSIVSSKVTSPTNIPAGKGDNISPDTTRTSDDKSEDIENNENNYGTNNDSNYTHQHKTRSTSCACKNGETIQTNGSSEQSTSCCQSQQYPTENNTWNEQPDDAIMEGSDSNDDDDDDDDDDDGEAERHDPEVMDMEDIGTAMKNAQTSTTPRAMVTPRQAKALQKEGYRLIGTHSAVKLCRWTKHQLRGRGGCYKHTFYGITSYQCMEATPSLACANKCVFCWRHHKNPVGKEWRWKTDDPYEIVDAAVQEHINMIKETKGIPGVQADRWREAHTVRHCALSLVGEPIMYPRINELLGELHDRKISSFLVTNGQHPQAISSLRPVTQLYVSVDAPTQESLIAIDRPLFQDAWDRLKESLSSLKEKGQRTVARLTVVKGWNSDEIGGYAQLVALGHVSLVEVKGVTFCGKSDASNLNMTNSPWHHEVVDLTKALKVELDKLRANDASIPEYDLACEHKHSCSVLLARVDLFTDSCLEYPRKWRTWIDYDKFNDLASHHAADPTFTFTVRDYTAPTPTWALFGSEEEGFDPTDARHRKAKKNPKYTKFDDRGIPTHDHNNVELGTDERKRLSEMMELRRKQIGEGSIVTELKGGAKEIHDASLMFRGMVIAK